MKTKAGWFVLNWFYDPLKMSFITSSLIHSSSKYFIIGKNNYSFSMHSTLLKFSFIFSAFLENNEALTMKCVILELTMIFELIIFENTFFSESFLEISLECVVRTILFTITIKFSIFEVAPIVIIIVL